VREISGCADAIQTQVVNETELRPHVDTEIFSDAIKIMHDHGLKVIVHVNLGHVDHQGVYPDTYCLLHPENWIKQPQGRNPISRCCVNNPEFISYTRKFFMDFFEKWRVDGYWFNEPNAEACICNFCREKFRRTQGEEMSGKADEENLNFQTKSLIEYISLVSDIAKEMEVTTACVARPPTTEKVIAFYRRFTAVKSLDILGANIYFMNLNWATEVVKKFRGICDEGNKLFYACIQGFKIPSGRENEIYEAGRIAAENGVDILCGWYHWRGTDNPERTWDTTYKMLIDFGKRK